MHAEEDYKISREQCKWIIFITSGTLFSVVVLISCVLIGTSATKVESNHYGIHVYRVDRTIENKVYTEGTHFTGPGDYFIQFARGVKNIEHSGNNALTCYTQDFVLLTLTLKFQITLKEANIIATFHKYGGDSQLVHKVHEMSRDALRDVCGKYTYQNFFEKRGEVEAHMRTSLDSDLFEFRETFELGALQLRNIQLPVELNDAIQAKEQALQSVARAESERQQTIITATTELEIAKALRATILIDAERYRDTTIDTANADYIATTAEWEALGDAQVEIRKRFSNTREFLDAMILS
jgi:regulator of protease activity HflC (stomatin/prohibitin superfamily)